MKIAIDRTKCRGHQSCTAVAPNVFDIDGEFKAIVINPEGESEEQITRAAQACPTKAIILEDQHTRKRIFPPTDG